MKPLIIFSILLNSYLNFFILVSALCPPPPCANSPSSIAMVRKLKYHEQKLLKRVNFFHWKKEDNIREIKVLQTYRIQDREDYHRYNKICGQITQLANKLSLLDPTMNSVANVQNNFFLNFIKWGSYLWMPTYLPVLLFQSQVSVVEGCQ